MKLIRTLAALFALLPSVAFAQNSGTVAAGAYAIGKGPGVSGYTSLLCSAGQLAVGQAGTPICRTVSGDWTLNAAGVSTLATVNGNVGSFGSATQCASVTVNGKGLITAASQSTCTPAVGSVTGLGTGVGAALAVNIGSAGAPALFNGALGTPSSGVGSNLTALNATQLTSGTVPAARTNGHQNGTATNDNAAAGEIGEFISSSVPTGSAVALTSSTPTNVTSISLTAGDWDVSGVIGFLPAATTNVTQFIGSFSTTSATLDTTPGRFFSFNLAPYVPGANQQNYAMPIGRFSVATTTTVFLVAQDVHTVSTMGTFGIIRARRVR